MGGDQHNEGWPAACHARFDEPMPCFRRAFTLSFPPRFCVTSTVFSGWLSFSTSTLQSSKGRAAPFGARVMGAVELPRPTNHKTSDFLHMSSTTNAFAFHCNTHSTCSNTSLQVGNLPPTIRISPLMDCKPAL